MENSLNNTPQDNPDALDKAAKELFKGGGLEFAHLARQADSRDSDVGDERQMTNDDIYDFMQENRDRTFDFTTAEGRNFFNRFEEANARRNTFSLNQFKEVAGKVASVPYDMVAGILGNPLKTPGSLADAVLRDAQDLAVLLAQSEDPSSPLFKFKSYITGSGTTEERIKQFNEARWWNNRANALEEGKDTILEHWVPDDYRQYARKLIDPKLANALSYIGLDAPHFIRDSFRRGGVAVSADIMKGGVRGASEFTAKTAMETQDWFSTSASKFRNLSQKITGETLSAAGDLASAPFAYIQEKIARGSTEIESRIGHIPPEVSNGASTLLADVGSTAVQGGVEISPVKSVLFSLGVKPIAEYASVLGKEMVDAAQGVVRIKPEFSGLGLMDRLSLNGGRIGMSKEAQAVAKFANVVVGWPASMAFPTLKRAVGDAAYMGVLGYANARGEGASSGFGMGFAWGGFSGSLRHIHNVYNQSVAHRYIIDNFDGGQLLEIEKHSPRHAENVREYLSGIDSHGDNRVSATVRAEIMMGWAADAQTELRYKSVADLVSEFGPSKVKRQLGDFENARSARGAAIEIDGKNYIWVNKEGTTAEAVGHEYGHRFLDILLSRTDGSAVDALKSFIGNGADKGVVPDDVLATFIAHYSMKKYGYDSKWMNDPTPSFVHVDGPAAKDFDPSNDLNFDKSFGNLAYAKEQIRKFRAEMASDPAGMMKFAPNKDGKLVMMAFQNFPLMERLMHETFAYSHSNNMLIRSPDVFLRNPNLRTIRYVMENWQMLNNQRLVSNLEAAGYVLKEIKKDNGETVLQSMFWDDGKYVSLPMLDKWGEEVMKRVLKNSDVSVTTMSPERAEAFLKQTNKDRFLNGGKIMTKKEVEDTITVTADAIAATLDSLPDAVRPKWSVEKGGSKKIKLTELTKEAWDAIEASNVYHPEEFKVLVGMVDVLKQIEAGKPVFNTFTAQYIGWSKQVVEAALGERLKGRQVPVTFRHFAPFDIELTVSKFDELGNPLKNPRSHITIHAHDVNVLNRRKMNMWQRPDVKALFRDFGHFSETFVSWFSQLSNDPSIRVSSADFLRAEFGSNAEKVRDMMYETWGGRKRNDESYINTPEGYAGGRDGPDYPIHSLRFDLMANVLKQSQIFPEAFQGQVMGLYHRHGIAYEPMRRNMMLGNFVQRDLEGGRRFYTDANGYEIRGEEPKLKLFNMFGNLIGTFSKMENAQKAAERDMAKKPKEELMPNVSDLGDERTPQANNEYVLNPNDVHSGSANFLIGNNGSFEFRINGPSRLVRAFKIDSAVYMGDFANGVAGEAPRIKVIDLVDNAADLKKVLPDVENYYVEASPYASWWGGVTAGIQVGTKQGVLGYLSPEILNSEGGIETASYVISEALQQLVDIAEGRATARRVPWYSPDVHMRESSAAQFRAHILLSEAYSELGRTPTKEEFSKYLKDRSDESVKGVIEQWRGKAPVRAQNVPRWIKGKQFKDGTDRISYTLLTAFSQSNLNDTAGSVPSSKNPDVTKFLLSMNDWMCGITEKFEDGNAHVLDIQGTGVVISPPDFFNLPADLVKTADATTVVINGQTIYPLWDFYNEVIQGLSLTHAISKFGNRDTLTNQSRKNNDFFKANNIEASRLTDRPYEYPAGSGIYTAVQPDVARQAGELWSGVFGSNGALIVTLAQSDISSGARKDSLRMPRMQIGTNTLYLMSGMASTGKDLGLTTLPHGGNISNLKGKLGRFVSAQGMDAIFDMHTELVLSGNAPFLGAFKGKLHKMYAKAEHLATLELAAAVIGVPFNKAKDGNAQGLTDFVRNLESSGVNSADKAFVYRWAVGCKMAEIGRSVLDGDKENLHKLWTNQDPENVITDKYTGSIVGPVLDATEFGQSMVNKGFSQLAYALASSSAGQKRSKLAKKGKKEGWGGPNSVVERTLVAPSKTNPSFGKAILKVADDAMERMRANGHDPANMDKSKVHTSIRSSHMMLGGMRARELDMIASGAMRFVKTDSGQMYKAFEFSDKEAVLLTEKVGGKLHLLPFSKGGEADFDAYYKDFMRSQAPMMSTDALKLGELIDHKILFAHYPSLKDVRVEWEYGYGAHYNSDADVITLGIDRYIGKAMHERGSPDHLDYASFGIDFERKALDTILHEIQHAIQHREQWTDSASTASSVIFQKAGLILANNIVGVAGRTLSTSRVVNDSGRVFFTDDPSSAPTQFDNRQVIQSIVKMAGSPMHLHLRQYAYPNLIKVAEESMLGLADAHMHHPPEHMSRINAEKLSKKIGVVRGKAIEAMEAFKRGDLREVEAKDIVCEHVMELENLIESGVGMLSIENSPVADRLYNSMSNSLKYMRRSMQALNAFQIISKMADSGAAGMDVGAFAAKAREIFDNVSMMQYLSQRHEIEADLTERRSQMTQEELNATGINPNMTRANGLDAISGAMDIGYAGNSIRAIGMALKNKSPIRVANLMVGGTGDAKLKPEERSNDALKLMGRGALVSWVVRTLENELQQLNAVAVYGRGWEVGKDGVPRLTFKQGIIRIKGGRISHALDKKRYVTTAHGGYDDVPVTDEFKNASIQQQGDSKLGIFNAIAKDGETTITLQDVARIIDGIVVSESELVTPTEAMDIIIRDDFPSVVEVKNLTKLLKDRGISDDGLTISNAALFSQMSDADLPQTVTKGELIDIMAIVHRQLVHERTATRSVGTSVITKAKFDVSGVTPLKLLEAVDKTHAPTGYYDNTDPVRKFVNVAIGGIAFPEHFGTTHKYMGPTAGNTPNRFGILNLDFATGEATLNPVKPDWVEPEVWDRLVSKWKSKGYLDAGFFGMMQSLQDTDAERVMKEKVLQRANMLNRSLTRKLFLLKPFYEKAIASLQKGLDESFSTEDRNRFMSLKFSLLDEASMAMIEPDLAGFRSGQNVSIGANANRQFGSGTNWQESHQDVSYETTRTLNQLGIAPAVYASGYSPEVRDAFIELQTLMPVVGTTAESTIHANTPSNYYRNIGDKEVHLYSLIDDLGDRNFVADTNIADNLLSITTSATATKALAEKVIATLAEGGAGELTSSLQPLRLLVSIADRASRLAESASLLVGDSQSSSKDYVNRNVQREYSGSGSYTAQNKFIQELSLLRGYRGADGTLVLQENLMADTSAALAHTANIEIPIWNHALVPAPVATRDFSVPAVQAIVMKDLAARSILFGAINDGAGNVTRPMSYIAPLSELAASIAQTQNGGVYSERGVYIDGSVAYTSGLHALHSALYLASFEKGLNVTRPLTADSAFYMAWAQPRAENLFHVQHAGGHTIESFAVGLAPFLATAMTEKLPMLKQGKLVAGDILSVEQRALLKSAREAYKGHDFSAKVTPEMDAARKAFFDTLDSQQVNAIVTHLSSSNVGYGLITMLGVMNAYQQIKKLPDSPALSQALGNDARAELIRQLDLYLTEGRYVTEQGVNDVGGTVNMYDKGITHQYIGQMTITALGDPITQNAILAAWSVMDSKATAYVPDMTNGEPDTRRPHASLQTYVSPRAYAYQPETFLSANTAVGSKFTLSLKHPTRTHSIKAENTTPNPRETFLQPVGFKGEPMGLAEALFNIYDPTEINPAFNADLPPLEPAQQPDPLLGVHMSAVRARTNPISQTFIRKHVVDSIIAQAKRMKSDKVSIEPARFRLSGRSVAYRATRPTEVETGSSSIKFKGHSAGYSAIFDGFGMIPSRDEGVNTVEGFSENRPFMTNPMKGFAWKRLEDGRLVINITGDHAGYKIGYLGRQYIPDDVRKKIPVGFSLVEALGYDPYSGDIVPPNIHIALYGGMSTANYSSEPAGMIQAMSVSGESWRKQIVKSARARILKGDAIRARYEGIDANKAGIIYKNSSMHVGFDTLMGSDNAHNDAEAMTMALSILGHRTGHQYMSLTLPANASPEMIRSMLHNILIGAATMDTYKVLSRSIGNNMSSIIPHLGDGGSIYSVLRSVATNLAPRDNEGTMSRIRALMHQDNAGSAILDTALMNEIIRKGASRSPEFQEAHFSPSLQDSAMKKRAEQVLGRNPRLLGDIEAFAEMATKSDHGYSIPDAERHVTKNGDTTLAIELMFPNRPDLTKFAWDGKEDNGVSIVHRGPKSKPTGYFVTYDYQTGIDQYGNPITTKKVVPVKTLAEAESLRNQFGVVASRAILAQALVAAGMESPQIKQGVTNPDSNVDFSVQDGKALRQNETGLAMVFSKQSYVGDFDKAMTATEAKAVSQVLSSGTVLQTKLPSVEVRKANLMIGSRDARELEGLLRRKLTFGNGSGPVEFSSKLMRVVAYGKRKTGRDLYPDSMTGAEWYKFLKENTVSKDEMRMTGIVYLLHENNDTLLTRQDLAEFIYTVYPRTSRQIRRQNNSTIMSQNIAIKAGNMSGFYNLPFIDDVQTKETFVVNTHLDNLKKVVDLIEQKMAVEETKADATALADNLRKSIDFTIAEMGMPPDALSASNMGLRDSIEYMRSIYASSVSRSATTEGFYGDTRGVRPAQLEFIMRDVVWGRLADQYKTIEAALGDLGFINPYEIVHADQTAEKNPFNTAGSGLDEARSQHHGVGIMGSSGTPSENPSFAQQNVYFHGGNYHASYATFNGFYQSSPQFVEVTNRRLLEESKRAKATLKDRMDHATDPQQKRKIKSIIDTIERVEAVRKLVGGSVSDFSHYDNNDQGTFQLGHVRSTEAVLLGEYGIANPNEPAFHGEDPVSGYSYSPETVIGIEEIQSDSFQYHTFGPPNKPEMSLPDSTEQIEGLKLAGDLVKMVETKKRLEASVKDVQASINNNLRHQMMSSKGDNAMNTMFLMKNLGELSPIELYMLKDDLKLKDTGRTMQVPEHYRQYVGMERIPVYQMVDYNEFRRSDNGDFADDESRNRATNLGRKMAIQISNLASGDVLASILPESIMGMKIGEDTFTFREDASSRPQPTPSFVFMALAAQDPEVISKSIHITESQAAMRGATDVDWDAVAARTIDRIEAMRDKVVGEPIGRDFSHLRDFAGPRASRLARAKFFDNLIQTYRERLASPRNRMLMPDVQPDGEKIAVGFGRSYEDTPLGLEIKSNPNRYTLVHEPLGYDRMNPAQLLFPTKGMLHGASKTSLDFRSSEMRNLPEMDGDDVTYGVQFVAANTALGQFVASSVSGVIAHISRMGTVPAEIKSLDAEIAKITPLVPISGGNAVKISNSLPFGVEDIYKPVALNGTILRAANAGFGAITYADARMQVMRGHSMDIVPTMLIGRQANMFTMSSDSHTAALMSQLHMLPEAVRNQLHGGLFKRLAEADNEFFVKAFRNSASFEHNGVSGDISIHFTLAAKDAASHLLTGGVMPADMGEMSSFWRAVTENRDAAEIVDGYLGRPHDSYGVSGESSMIAPDGKPYKAKDLATDFFKKMYGVVQSGEKSDRQRVIDSAVANAGFSTFYWSEQGRAMGYVSQYGAPSWFIKSIMYGQKQASLDGFSSDAFQRPLVTIADDGTYTLVDPKSGRAIMEKIKDPTSLREAFFQNSKYLGRLPYIAKFVSEWSPVGGYVTQGHTSGKVYNAESMRHQLDESFTTDDFPKKNKIPSDFAGVVAGAPRAGEPLSSGNSFNSSAAKPMAPFGGVTQYVGTKAWMKHVNNVDVQSPEALSRAMATYFSCGGPVLRFKPRNPTEAHKKAFRRKIVEGIAMLMPSNGGIGKPQATTENLEMLDRMYRNFTKVTKGRKIPTQGEALEDDDEYAR